MDTLSKIIDILNASDNDLYIRCNDGYIMINGITLDFTYIGTFGRAVLHSCINSSACNDIPHKLAILSQHIDTYSALKGGITFNNI